MSGAGSDGSGRDARRRREGRRQDQDGPRVRCCAHEHEGVGPVEVVVRDRGEEGRGPDPLRDGRARSSCATTEAARSTASSCAAPQGRGRRLTHARRRARRRRLRGQSGVARAVPEQTVGQRQGARAAGTTRATALRMALAIGALPIGQWSGCHATPINAAAPDYGVSKLTDKTNRLSYPYGVMINRDGVRFVDEAENFWSFTYAKFGGVIIHQPGFARVSRSSTRRRCTCWRSATPPASRSTADTLDALVGEARLAITKVSQAHASASSTRAATAAAASNPRHPRRHSAPTAWRCPSRTGRRSSTRAPLRCLPRHRRHHVHLRRPEDHAAGAGARTPAGSPIEGLYC